LDDSDGRLGMATTMKAAVVHEFGRPLRIEDVPVPEPGPDQILVKVEACGVCHTDLHAADGDWPVKPTPPFIQGHEGVGMWRRSDGTRRASTKATGGDPGCTAPAAVAVTA
jgi:D-arabinose 1-dehydrogenase-like Zn-dependent alcohol dehydrogenase